MAKKNKEPKEPKAKKVKEPKVKKEKKAKVSKLAPNSSAGEKKKYRVIGSPVRVLAVTAVISLLLGVVLYKLYYNYYSYIDYIVGGIIALVGIISLVFYFGKRMIDGVYRSEFALGLVCLGVGGWIILRSGTDPTFFLTVIGLLCALDGIIKLQYALDLARMEYKKWWLPLILSILGLAIGVVILMDLLGGLEWLYKVAYTGLALCVNGVLDLVMLLLVALRNRKASKAAEAAAIPAVAEIPAADGPDFEVEIVEETELPAAEEFPASIPGEAAVPAAAEVPAEVPAEAAGEAVAEVPAEEIKTEE